ncbi:hypothetical protein CFter6_4248 [Collimonas fungivorans]|uniref:Uncharacterized protein n=1 Tax=Collimonas fungivorans TaxID=158899 RepID=A0A127PGC5_9BURK|nr:hypothetical protein CFter6_4248 [Collimonas fungivorans]
MGVFDRPILADRGDLTNSAIFCKFSEQQKKSFGQKLDKLDEE